MEMIFNDLRKKYKKATLSKSELRVELGLSTATLDRYLSEGGILPPHHKMGEAKSAKVIFNIVDVAEFLASKDQQQTPVLSTSTSTGISSASSKDHYLGLAEFLAAKGAHDE